MPNRPIGELKKDHFEIQRAINFLVKSCLDINGKQKIQNPKPVVLHSIRVGMKLYDLNYDIDLVIAGILHDLIEDAGVSADQITQEFNPKISTMVAALSFDPEIDDEQQRSRDYLLRVIQAGKETMIVAVADLSDNIPFLVYAENREVQERVLAKWKEEVEEFGKYISEEPIYNKLVEEFACVDQGR